jgi:putative membrane protein
MTEATGPDQAHPRSQPRRAEAAGPAAGVGGSPASSPAAGSTGSEPDARYTFANERTFLAWSRTSLALIVAGLGIVQLLPPFPHVPWGRHLIGVPLIVLGAIVAIAGYTEWVMNQRALRHGDPIPRSVVPTVLTVTITSIGVLSAIVLLLSAIGG